MYRYFHEAVTAMQNMSVYSLMASVSMVAAGVVGAVLAFRGKGKWAMYVMAGAFAFASFNVGMYTHAQHVAEAHTCHKTGIQSLWGCGDK